MIKCIGHLWHVDDVFWGKRGAQAASLLGVPENSRSSEPIDFRDQIGIYVLYADFELVYVGQTGGKGQRLLQRLNQHRRDHLANRWNRFSWFGVRWVKKGSGLSAITQAAHPQLKDVLNHFEALLIETAEPSLNSQGGRFGRGVIWYRQVRDTRLGPSVEEMVRKLWEKSCESDVE